MTTPRSNKTYKRELAVVLLMWLMCLSVYNTEALAIVALPVLAVIAGAFGLDWWGKTGPANKSGTGDER
jgi:hypothetical protein